PDRPMAAGIFVFKKRPDAEETSDNP
ncbi:hypothetical protein KIPB_006127, partial [Kipferlia bialata]